MICKVIMSNLVNEKRQAAQRAFNARAARPTYTNEGYPVLQGYTQPQCPRYA